MKTKAKRSSSPAWKSAGKRSAAWARANSRSSSCTSPPINSANPNSASRPPKPPPPSPKRSKPAPTREAASRRRPRLARRRHLSDLHPRPLGPNPVEVTPITYKPPFGENKFTLGAAYRADHQPGLRPPVDHRDQRRRRPPGRGLRSRCRSPSGCPPASSPTGWKASPACHGHLGAGRVRDRSHRRTGQAAASKASYPPMKRSKSKSPSPSPPRSAPATRAR